MTILVASADDDAAGALSSALSRAGHSTYWESTIDAARERAAAAMPLVLVADTALDGHEALIHEVVIARPWTRVYLMVDPAVELETGPIPAVLKPFDAAELAVLLSREQELAEIDRGRRNLERQLEHAERLAAVGRLSASMAHEINNPLAVIFASATYVAETAERIADAELGECARDLELAAERIGSFVQHVCGFARRERPQLTDTPISVAVEMALRMVRPRARDRGVEVVIEPLPAVNAICDPPRLSQAILNVLANAIDASGERHGRVVLSAHAADGQIVIRIDDDGPGIDAQIADHVFEPFATTKPHGQGTGLGLAITHQIMMDHRGRATLSSRPEGGARAELFVPTLDVSAHPILVVTADVSLRRALSSELRRAGFSVQMATPEQAGDALVARPVSVVVCDADCAPRLGAAGSNARIVAVSPEPCAVPDADRVLATPWESACFVAAVRTLCAAR